MNERLKHSHDGHKPSLDVGILSFNKLLSLLSFLQLEHVIHIPELMELAFQIFNLILGPLTDGSLCFAVCTRVTEGILVSNGLHMANECQGDGGVNLHGVSRCRVRS